MFRITCNITIDKFTPMKATAATWRRSVDEYADSARIYLPGVCLYKSSKTYEKKVIPTGQAFTEGMAVTIDAGYDGRNVTRFKGFIKRINYSVPLELECEGYSYLLGKIIINKSYLNTTVKDVLKDLVNATEIKLSDDIPNIEIPKLTLINLTGLQVLEWFKHKMSLYCYFNFDELYVGGEALQLKDTINHRLGWNTVKDSALLFNADKEYANVNITINARSATGIMKKIKRINTTTNEKIVRVEGYNPDDPYLQQIRDSLQKKLDNKGYTGSITTFLEPVAAMGMASNITDAQYAERSGKYFINSVEGEFSPSKGGRQKIGIGFKL